MAIYADKKGNKLTGRYRVEVQGKLGRYRDRCPDVILARAKETEFLKMREDGLPPPSSSRSSEPPVTVRAKTFSDARKLAGGRVWRNMPSEAGNLSRLKIIEELMGNLDLDKIDTAWVEEMREKLTDSRGIQDASVNHYVAALSAFLQWSARKGFRRLSAMPEMPWAKVGSHRIRWITPAEEQTLLSHLPDNVARLVGIAIRTGMRRGELLSLEPSQVTQGWVHLFKTKSDSPRSIPVTPADQETALWLTEKGNMPTVDDLRYGWARARKSMSLLEDEDFVFHSCRHTCATRLVQANVNLLVIQRWMGHKDIKTTLRYAHLNDGMLTQALSSLTLETVGETPAFCSERPVPTFESVL